MNKSIHVQIDINALRDFIKANPSYVFKGKKDYISLTLWANDGPDKFGNDYAVKPRVSKELKASLEKVPYVGNAKINDFAASAAAGEKPASRPIKNAPAPDAEEEVPF